MSILFAFLSPLSRFSHSLGSSASLIVVESSSKEVKLLSLDPRGKEEVDLLSWDDDEVVAVVVMGDTKGE